MTEVLAAVTAVAVVLLVSMGVYLRKVRGQLEQARRKLNESLERIEHLAMRDKLTGGLTRRFLMESLAREPSRAERTGQPFSICIFDIDNFKAINDSRG